MLESLHLFYRNVAEHLYIVITINRNKRRQLHFNRSRTMSAPAPIVGVVAEASVAVKHVSSPNPDDWFEVAVYEPDALWIARNNGHVATFCDLGLVESAARLNAFEYLQATIAFGGVKVRDYFIHRDSELRIHIERMTRGMTRNVSDQSAWLMIALSHPEITSDNKAFIALIEEDCKHRERIEDARIRVHSRMICVTMEYIGKYHTGKISRKDLVHDCMASKYTDEQEAHVGWVSPSTPTSQRVVIPDEEHKSGDGFIALRDTIDTQHEIATRNARLVEEMESMAIANEDEEGPIDPDDVVAQKYNRFKQQIQQAPRGSLRVRERLWMIDTLMRMPRSSRELKRHNL